MSADLVRPSLTDALIARIVELIRGQGLGPGDRLPSARELAQRFGVATPTIREALRQLQATGAIDIRHGSGMYVNAALERVVMANPNVPVLDGEQLVQLLDARLLIEPHLAGLAARRCGPQHERASQGPVGPGGPRAERGSRRPGPPVGGADTGPLRAALDAAERHLDGDDARLHEANMAFHRAVALASGHRILQEVLDSLLSVHAGEQREILQLFDDRSRDHVEHLAVLTAIEAGQEDEARELMRRHLDDVAEVVRRRLSSNQQ